MKGHEAQGSARRGMMKQSLHTEHGYVPKPLLEDISMQTFLGLNLILIAKSTIFSWVKRLLIHCMNLWRENTSNTHSSIIT